ncbi:winged helix-turn-helix domain-containing protein [Tenacibaculum agarivorans]|uniref:winged helix-turn-helix domain-containing protein n=1 Tax=Tenacibaculum agarivorans TaxID=1908389 RepID=UPI00094BC294|nr:transcriptional regulator [Tenacibaculum agarivorans]
MKNLLNNINKAFDHRIRLGIMSILVVNEYADFNTLKELLGATDGNLASHSKALEKVGFIRVEKQFIGRKPNTKYYATALGKEEFKKHVEALERLIKGK